MQAQEFYDELKEALKFFGLSWGQMNLMQVDSHEGYIIFRYDNRSISINT